MRGPVLGPAHGGARPPHRSVDVELADDDATVETRSGRAGRRGLETDGENMVARRAGIGLGSPIRAALLPASGAGTNPMRERGVYLITGGLGGVGLTLAGYLARAVRARLVLVGRHGLPTGPNGPAISRAMAMTIVSAGRFMSSMGSSAPARK